MTKLYKLLVIPVLTTSLAAATPGLDEAEVKLPYGELKKLLSDAARPEKPAEPLAALLSVHLRVAMDAGKPVVDATFSSASFGTGLALVPLLGGNLTMATRQPAEARVLIQGLSLIHI